MFSFGQGLGGIGWAVWLGHIVRKVVSEETRILYQKVGPQKDDSLVAVFTRPFCGFIHLPQVPLRLKRRGNIPPSHLMRSVSS